jgi:four helix bundle protein
MAESIVANKAYQFSIRVVKLHLYLWNSQKQVMPISRQLLRAGTSVAANVAEAIGGHSERDFSAKMSIAYKEARETSYWLRLLRDSGIIDKKISASFLSDIDEIMKILGSILKTVKSKQRKK